MSNGDVIIICGTGGEPITDKTITVYDAPFSVAIKIDQAALEAVLEAGGLSHEAAVRKINRFASMVEHDWWTWGEKLEDLGIPYERHTPHAQP